MAKIIVMNVVSFCAVTAILCGVVLLVDKLARRSMRKP